jgi:phosphohistidine phosphatase SixA
VQVFLIRHAEAVAETLERRDPHRHLTARGRDQARQLGERLRWHDCVPTHIWASPLARAIQTAELVAAALHSDLAVEIEPALAPDGAPREVAARVRALPAGAAAMIVGHEPHLSAIGTVLSGVAGFGSLTKAEAARIVDGALRWRFAWNAEAPALARR